MFIVVDFLDKINTDSGERRLPFENAMAQAKSLPRHDTKSGDLRNDQPRKCHVRTRRCFQRCVLEMVRTGRLKINRVIQRLDKTT